MKKKNVMYLWRGWLLCVLWALSSSIYAQTATVRGTVTDANREPVIGATVIVQNQTSNGTVTDLDGNYVLNDVPTNATLQFSYVGMQPQSVAVNGRQVIDVVMQNDTKLLEEVVVVGYGAQKKVNLTGAVSSVNSDVLQNRTTPNVANMLAGQMTGVTIVQNTGQPGADAGLLRVRGIGTIRDSYDDAAASAMVIVDGVESSMNSVNPNDIESISVLKDAAASSIYGVRAANGVILITTRRGTQGKAKISYDNYVGWQKALRLPKFLNAYDFAVLFNEAHTNDGAAAPYTEEQLKRFRDGSDPDHYADSDWLGTLLSENGMFHNHYVSISGGSESVRYSTSFGYHDKKGLIPNTSYNKYDVRANLHADLTQRLSLGLNLSAYRSRSIEPAAGMQTIMHYAFRETPVTPIQFKNGNYGLFKNEHNSVAYARKGGTSTAYRTNMHGNVSLNYQLIDGLTLRGNAAVTSYLIDMHDFEHAMQYYTADSDKPIQSKQSSLINEDRKNLEVNLQTYLDYNKTFGKHTLSGLLGYSQLYNNWRVLRASRKNLPSSNQLDQINAGDATTQQTAGYETEYALRSVFGRINYNYDNRYLIEANLRYDGTSRFPKDKRFGAFPSVSLGWRLSEEEFFRADWVDNLKLRASWGLLGNQEIGSYAFYEKYVYAESRSSLSPTYSFGNMLAPGISISRTMANKNITWEKTSQINVGVDAGFLNGRLTFSGDFFVKDTRDILLNLPIPRIAGVNPPMQNAGKVRNIGFETQLGYNGQANKDFKYYANFNFSYVHNEITDLQGGDIKGGRSVGDPVWAYYGYISDGIFRTEEEIKNHARQTMGTPVPGDLKYRDISGKDGKPDNVINANDRKLIGSYFPKINYGLRLGFEYKSIDFSTLLQGAAAVDGLVKKEVRYAFYNSGKVTDKHLDRWTPQNPNGSFPRLSIKNSEKNQPKNELSSFWVQDASYLKMRNIQLGYTLPNHWLIKQGVSKVRLYCSIDNVFTLTQFEGADPESPAGDTGESGTYYPMTRSYSFGLNVSF